MTPSTLSAPHRLGGCLKTDLPTCVCCGRREGDVQPNRYGEFDAISPDTPLGEVTKCEKCGRMACPECVNENECCEKE